MTPDISYALRARAALDARGFRHSRTLGQNFLLDELAVREIIARAGVKPGDNILEIGPGAGVMTAVMADAGARVLAVELDRALEGVLSDVLGQRDNVELVFADAMKADLPALIKSAFGEGVEYSIVANLPYYITSDFLTRAVRLSPAPFSVTAMVQKEAAERVLSAPGDKHWCALAATIQYFAEVSSVMDAPPSLFTPPPHVDSSLIRLDMRKNRLLEASEEIEFLKLIQAAFRMRRKTLVNNLTSAFNLSREAAINAITSVGLNAQVRGEALSLEQLIALLRALAV